VHFSQVGFQLHDVIPDLQSNLISCLQQRIMPMHC